MARDVVCPFCVHLAVEPLTNPLPVSVRLVLPEPAGIVVTEEVKTGSEEMHAMSGLALRQSIAPSTFAFVSSLVSCVPLMPDELTLLGQSGPGR